MATATAQATTQATAPTLTLANTMATAHELMHTGNQPSSLLFALWIAACSPNQRLYTNGLIARSLAPSVTAGLPDRETLVSLLRAHKAFFTGRLLDTLFACQAAERDVTLVWFQATHPTLDAAWRDDLCSLVHAHGGSAGMKVISFAALLLDPFACPFAVVDRHHCARLGLGRQAPGSVGSYLATEHAMRSEWLASGERVPFGVYQWYRWSLARQISGAEPVSATPESHRLLSPRWYPAA